MNPMNDNEMAIEIFILAVSHAVREMGKPPFGPEAREAFLHRVNDAIANPPSQITPSCRKILDGLHKDFLVAVNA